MTLRNIVISAAIILASTSVEAQKTITVKANRAVKSLVESWANAYKEIHPDIDVQVVGNNAKGEDLTLINSVSDDDNATYVGRYAILPITTTNNPLFAELTHRNWNKSDLRKLYFTEADDIYDEDSDVTEGKAGKLREQLTVYSGTSSYSNASVFASHFGFSTSEIRGNKVAGDDLFILNAINKNQTSISFNNIAYLYDINTRSLKEGIAILPLKVKKDIETALQNGNLDETLSLLENNKYDLIPVEEFGFVVNNQNPAVSSFLEWIILEGKEYNHQNGFLQLTANEAQQQLSALALKSAVARK